MSKPSRRLARAARKTKKTVNPAIVRKVLVQVVGQTEINGVLNGEAVSQALPVYESDFDLTFREFLSRIADVTVPPAPAKEKA